MRRSGSKPGCLSFAYRVRLSAAEENKVSIAGMADGDGRLLLISGDRHLRQHDPAADDRGRASEARGRDSCWQARVSQRGIAHVVMRSRQVGIMPGSAPALSGQHDHHVDDFLLSVHLASVMRL